MTQRELWKASGHRAGSRERADKAEIRRSIRLQLAIVVFAAVIMVFVLLGTILNAQGSTVDTRPSSPGSGATAAFAWRRGLR